jgi:FADH2 O2-dependent halogenase
LEEKTLAYIGMHDRLVSNSIKSWRNYELWRVYSVLWLLGAYLEYLGLSMARIRSQSRDDYFERLKDYQLAGGGFQGFFEIQNKIDLIIENLDMDDEAAVQQVIIESATLLKSFFWLPEPFRKILEGKNHLSRRKFRLSLFSRSQGFMGSGAYRNHFFGDLSLWKLLLLTTKDRIRYSRKALLKNRGIRNMSR